jgi:hypothetical protein
MTERDSNNVYENARALVIGIREEIDELEDLTIELVLDTLACLGLTITSDPDAAAEALVLGLTDPDPTGDQ